MLTIPWLLLVAVCKAASMSAPPVSQKYGGLTSGPVWLTASDVAVVYLCCGLMWLLDGFRAPVGEWADKGHRKRFSFPDSDYGGELVSVLRDFSKPWGAGR